MIPCFLLENTGRRKDSHACHCGCGERVTLPLFRSVDTDEELALADAPVGAMWYAEGQSLVVRLPGGYDWQVDARSANCAKPEDSVHKCWVRHGEPPNVTVDATCAGGTGNILTPDWHGFLRDGQLVALPETWQREPWLLAERNEERRRRREAERRLNTVVQMEQTRRAMLFSPLLTASERARNWLAQHGWVEPRPGEFRIWNGAGTKSATFLQIVEQVLEECMGKAGNEDGKRQG